MVGQQSILFFGSAPVSVVKGKIAGNHGEIELVHSMNPLGDW